MRQYQLMILITNKKGGKIEMKKKIMTKEDRQKIMELFKDSKAKEIKIVDSEEYCRENMIIYGMNISVLRQFIRIEDGLKPVSRRLLWTMYHDHNLRPDGRMVKAPEFIGHVAKYHPHGDIGSTFECLTRPWENNAPIIEVRGNKGALSGEGAANPRYLDAKLSLYAWKCFFEDFDKDTAAMTENYIRSDVEPVYLPSRYPNFLLNTSSGIGWGYYNSFPPFNLIEAFRLTQALIKNPNATNVKLFPDSPRGYNIIDNGTIKDVCDAGIGTVPIEASIEYIEDDHSLYVTGFPEGVMFDDVMTKIANLSKEKKLSGIKNLVDTTVLNDASFTIELTKGANPYQVIDELYSANVGLKGSASIMFFFAERTSLSQYGLKGAILEWIDRRVVDKQKYYIKKLGQFREEMHALQGLIPVISDSKKFDRVIEVIRRGENDDENIKDLKAEFGYTSYQCSVLLDIKIKQNNKNRVEQLKTKLVDLEKKSHEFRSIVASKEKIKEKIYEELEEGIKLFGTPRVCKIIKEGERERPELFYRLVITKKFIKKLSIGGKQVGLIMPDDDIIAYFPEVSENDVVLVIDDLGRVYKVPIKKLASCDQASKGVEMISAIGLKSPAIRSILINKKMLERKDTIAISMFTEQGVIKTSPISQYITAKTEITGILLNDDDKVCWSYLYDMEDNTDVQQLVYTKNGFGISVNMSNISIQDRLTKGVKELKLDGDDVTRGVTPVSLSGDVFVLTTKGYGKICELASIFEASKRRQDMVRITSLHDGDEVFKIIPVPDEDTTITVYLRSGEKKEFSVKEIEKLPRLSKGKKLVPVRTGDSIYRIKLD